MSNLPIPSTYAEVAVVLRDMAEHVAQGDSFEGSIEYGIPDVPEWEQRGETEPEGYEQPEVMLRCVYRIGNLMGQGGVRIIGTMNPPPDMSGEQTT